MTDVGLLGFGGLLIFATVLFVFGRWELFTDPYPQKRAVVVTTKSGESFRGILWARGRDHLVLKSPEWLHGKEKPDPLAGEIVIDRPNVDYIQVLYGAP